MQGDREYRKSPIDVIKRNTKIFNWIVLIIVSVHLLLIIQFLYLILADFSHSYFVGKNIIDAIFSFQISGQSGITILSIVTGLVVIGLYVVNTASKDAVIKIEDYSNKINTLLVTTNDIREIVYGDVLLDKILDSSLKITGADAGLILLLEGDKLVFKTVKGIESSKLLGFSIEKSHGVAGWVINNGNAVRVNNVKDDSRFAPEVDSLTGYKTNSVLCAPLKLSTETIGALELLNKKDGAFSVEDEELISCFADQAAISIARAKFYEDQKNYEIHLTDILLNTIDSHPEKRGHSLRVAKYSLLIANAINLSEDQKRRLHRASLLHDIGFIKMKDVLSKEEYKTHSQIGYEMLQPINFYSDIISIILHHHERYDGKGYPSGLKGETIPLESRLIAIAEAFDSMTSEESYKYIEMNRKDVRPSIEKLNSAIEELKNNAGTQFDPKLVEVFVNNIDESSLERIRE
jgi:putative nucleotidyltransferase with HDIG domain